MITLGVFDGLHRGHHALLRRLQKRSSKHGARVLVTYNPHPDLVLGKREDPRGEIFTYDEKLSLLQAYDLDAAIFLPFTRELASMSASEYLREILVNKLNARHIIIGYDQTFGKKRKGDYSFLKRMSEVYGYSVERISEIRFRGQTISSSLIRQQIRQGDVAHAGTLLGHPFFITGTVVRGNRRGRVINFPTANLDPPDTKILPAEGVYGGFVRIGNRRYHCMVNIGKNPTFQQGYLTVEGHIIDFSGDIYGESLRIYLLKRIRNEIKFQGLNELQKQLELDRLETLKIHLPAE